MGAVCGARQNIDKASRERHNAIEKSIVNDRKRLRDEVKLLLLGPGESGKSTIFKQMKIISMDGGFTRDELLSYQYVVYGNCITQMKVIVNAAQKLHMDLNSDEAKAAAQRIAQVPAGGDSWTPAIADDIDTLWNDPGLQAVYALRDRKYQLNDSAEYFFKNVKRFARDDYVPTTDDVLRARVRSTGIEEANFTFEDLSFQMLDVGGQRSERRKWIHCFDCVTAVIFVVSLSEYDQTLREDDTQNRTKESLLLFDEICNSPWFADTAFILFLNKIDLFREKIQRVDLKVTFPNYSGGCNFENASQFMKARFLEMNSSPHVIYTHFTCAVNTENIEFVFKCLRETILKRILDVMF